MSAPVSAPPAIEADECLAECPRCYGTMPAGPDAECPSEKCRAFLAWAAAQPQEEPES